MGVRVRRQEFVFDATANDWFIRPLVSADRREYCNNALGTAVPYANLGPPLNQPQLTFGVGDFVL